jgi:hypothetical protein
MSSRPLFAAGCAASVVLLLAVEGCSESESSPSTTTFDAGTTTFDSGTTTGPDASVDDAGVTPDADADVDSGKVIAAGLIEPIAYLQRSDSPFDGVVFPSYFHFEDWEDGATNTPGVTPSSTTLSASFGSSLIDSVDGDDGTVDGKCQKLAGTCNALFAGGTVNFTFDAVALGALPTHVGIAWTDGATNCDAVFEAYDATDTLIGSKTATAVGDSSNTGTVAEDRFFGVVHAAGVKKIVVKSSAGGVEVDHLQYGR